MRAPKVHSRGEALREAVRDVEFALGRGISSMQRSTFGAMLERAKLYSVSASAWETYRSSGIDAMVLKRQTSEPAYEMEFHVLAQIGRAFRLLDGVERTKRGARAALEALYGDRGARWGAGVIGNREAAVWHMTKTGRQLVGVVRSQFVSSEALQDDELLVNEAMLQKRQPNDIRRKRLEMIEREGSDMVEEAHAILAEVAWEQR